MVKEILMNAVTCQFGNEGERNYAPAANVQTLAVKDGWIGKLYLVVDKTTGLLGKAVKADGCDDVAADLYCTNARRVGQGWSIRQSLDSLGFPEVHESQVRMHLV
jgi:hypothetical protein